MLSIISSFTRRIQLKGIPRLLWAARSLFQKSNHIYPVGLGAKMLLDETQLYQWWYAINYAGYEILLLNNRLLAPQDLVIDVGANIGYVTIAASRQVGPSGQVVAFEPSPLTYQKLCGNVALNLKSNVVCIQKALSAKITEGTFIVATDDGLSRLENEKLNDFGLVMQERVKVEITTLDNVWTEKLSGRKVKLIKLDIEGHEFAALSGGANLLRSACTYVISEYNAPAMRQNGIGLINFVTLMADYGYEAYWVYSHTADWLRFTRMPSLRKVVDADFSGSESGEILFVKKSAHDDFLKLCGDIICT